MKRLLLTISVAAFALIEPVVPSAQERPLPNQDAFLSEVRKHLQTDSALQSSYIYTETRREQKLDGKGQVSDESVRVTESYPGLPGQPRWERLVSEDGKPTPPARLEAQDRERRKKAEDYARRLSADPAGTRAKDRRDWEKASRETTEAVDEVFRVFDIRVLSRQTIEGEQTIAFSLTPRAGAKPRTRDGGVMRHFAVRAWVSEADYELVRLEAEAIDTVPFGLGLVARMHKGAQLMFQRRKVNGEVWLPAKVTYSGSARVGLIKMIRRSGSSEYSNYRKFTVDTSTTYDTPK